MEIKGNYLHLLLKRTKKEIPYHENISPVSYPLQNQSMINQIVNVTVKDNFRVIPDDIPPYISKADPQIITLPCRVLRFDDEEPYKAVYVSWNYEYIVTDSSKNISEYPLINAIQYDKSDMDMIGQVCTLQSGFIFNDNMLTTFDYPGVVVASAASEPLEDIIVVPYPNDMIKVFTGAEVWCKLEGRNIIDDPTLTSTGKTLAVRKAVIEGKVPYGINEDPVLK